MKSVVLTAYVFQFWQNTTYRYYYTGFVHTTGTTVVLDHNARPAQIRPARYSPAAQRRAVPCGAVPCLALRCGAVSCCAVLSFERRAVPGVTRVVVSYLFSFFFT